MCGGGEGRGGSLKHCVKHGRGGRLAGEKIENAGLHYIHWTPSERVCPPYPPVDSTAGCVVEPPPRYTSRCDCQVSPPASPASLAAAPPASRFSSSADAPPGGSARSHTADC